MAHNVEPMDIGNIEGDFDNKENTYHHSNVLPRTPCTEKGYEELDVSELNMKLRYSITPASSPMSKSYTAHCLDNKNLECPENIVNSVDNANLTRSFNSTLAKNDMLSKSLKLQPLQLHSTDISLDNNRNTSVLRPLDTTVTEDGKNITVTVTEANDIDENLSLPTSSSSSALHTPEATTPTKEIPKHDGGSPIMRGLKSVLNMFRASQSPIPTAESEDHVATHDISSPVEVAANTPLDMSQVALASTPITARKQRETSSKRGSPLKESIVFNEDLEKELLWKDETTILFSEEKIPIHKLFFQQSNNIPPIGKESEVSSKPPVFEDSLNESVEFMDVSYNDSLVKNKTYSEITDAPPNANVAESDSEFVDCETTFTQQSEDEHVGPDVEKTPTPVNNSENSLNKTAQELQLPATEEGDKKSLNVTFAESKVEVVNQEVPELAENNKQEHVNSTVSIQSKDTMSQDTTQEIETRENSENVIEPLDGTISIQSGDKPTSSTLMNITHDFKTQMPNDLTPVLDATVNKDNSLSSSAMNNAIQSIEVTSSIDETKPADSPVSIESIDKPMSVSSLIMNTTQNFTQFAAKQLSTTTEIEMPVSASTFIMNATQNIESPLAVDNMNEPQNISETIEHKPELTSTFTMNSAQNNETPSAFENKNEQLNVTKELTDEPVLSSTCIINENQYPGTPSAVGNINEQLNATRNIQDNPVLSSTFIMNATDNAKEHSSSENVNEVLNNTLIKSEITKPLDATVTVSSLDTPVSSSTFTMDTFKIVDPHLATSENNELLYATVTVDSKDMLASSMFIKDITQDIKSQMPGENITLLDQTIFVDTQNKQVSSNASNDKKDITQNVEKKSSDITITMEPNSSSTFIKDMTQYIESQAGVSVNVPYLNTNAVVEVTRPPELPKDSENCDTSEAMDVILSTDKSMTSFADFKDVTHQIIDPEVLNNCINALDLTLNTDLNNQSCKAEEINSVTENASFSDGFKQSESPIKIEVPTNSKDTTILGQGNTETEICNQIIHDIEKDLVNVELILDFSQPINLLQEFVEQADKQTISDQFIPNEIVEIAKHVDNTVNIDSLNSSGDIAKVTINMSEGQVMNDVNRKIEIHKERGCGENVPANIPLPDEDDLEIEPLKAVQHCVINNVAISNVLPDVINNLDSSKIQDANRIDEVPIYTIEHGKAPADLITDTLTYNEVISGNSEMNKESNAVNEENYKLIDMTKAYLVNNYKKEISSEIPTELPPAVMKCDNEQRKVGESATQSEQHVESMDISYNAHDVFMQKDSEISSSDITTAVKSEIKSFGQGIAKTNEEKTDISLPSETICPQEKIDAVTNIMIPDMNNLQDMSIDDMDIDVVADTSVIAEKKEIVQSQKFLPNTQSDTIPIKDSVHEEIIVSENNSPYVLVSVHKESNKKFDSSLEEDFEKIENPFASRTKTSPSPPASPPIASKGYNFDFDDIDDPFATKTKIRASPPLDSPKQTVRPEKPKFKKEISKREPVKNKRKSFPVRPKPVTNKKNFNSTFDGSLPTENDSAKEKPYSANNDNVGVKDIPNLNKTQTTIVEDAKFSHTNMEESELNVIEKSEFENNTDNMSEVVVNVETQNEATSLENKSPLTSATPSSSDQSVYLSAVTSSGDSITARNVFNLPEIDDMNFNPFATKSKMRQSPPLSLEANTSQSKSDTTVILHENSEKVNVDKQHNLSHNRSGHDEKGSSSFSNTTCSSKGDKNTTVREVHTDSDDTIEGPFLEAEDNETIGLGLANTVKDGKFTDLGVQNDMMQFSDLPCQDNEDNELFIDAAAYEFLINQNKSNVVVDSGKESLFLKFDPLFAKRLSSEGIAAALSKIQKRQSTPKKMVKPPQIANAQQSVPGPSTSKVPPQQFNTAEDIFEDLNVTTSKPMMVVTPAVNPIVTPRKPITPNSSNRRSITFTSPAIAVIDRLLSMSANNSLVDQNTTITQVSREQNEADMALVQLRELLAEKEINVYNLRSESKELRDRLTTLESQMQSLEAESEQRLKKVNELTEKLSEKTKINKSMAAVVEEYERTIASLIAETEQDRKRHAEEREKLIKERDEQTAHLASMEVSFSDLHSKYEKSKQIILSCKANEDTYKKSIKDFEENLTKMQNNYELLKQHATSKLNQANQELEKINRAHESEVLKLNAMIKRKELHITSLEETLAQKTKANEELTAICDELINKVG